MIDKAVFLDFSNTLFITKEKKFVKNAEAFLSSLKDMADHLYIISFDTVEEIENDFSKEPHLRQYIDCVYSLHSTTKDKPQIEKAERCVLIDDRPWNDDKVISKFNAMQLVDHPNCLKGNILKYWGDIHNFVSRENYLQALVKNGELVAPTIRDIKLKINI